MPKLTQEQKVAAENLRRHWEVFKKKHNMSQEKAASLLEMTQGALSHYLVGRNPLNTDVTLKFAKLFGIHPIAISPHLHLDFKQDINNAIVITSAEEIELISTFRAVPEPGRLLFHNAVSAAKNIYLTGAYKRKKS